MISVIRNKLGVVLIALFFVSKAFAGINYSVPQDPTRDIEDLKIKVLGGYVDITRRWDVNKLSWTWNSRWANINRWSMLALTRNNSAYIYTHTADGRMIFQSPAGSTLSKAPWAPALQGNSTNPNEVIWKDRYGNQITFDNLSDGNTTPDISYIESYQDKNEVKVSFVKNAAQQISQIKDHHGNVIATFTWQGNHRLAKVTDYSGREVTYKYNVWGGLESVTDVMGQVWGYEYNADKYLIAQKNPNNTQIKFPFTTTNDNYKVEREPGTGLAKETKIMPSGLVAETWRNENGDVVKRMENGEVDYTAEYSYTVSDDKKTYKEFYYRDLTINYLNYGEPEDGKKYCQLISAESLTFYNFTGQTFWTGCTYSRTESAQAKAYCATPACDNSSEIAAARYADRVNPLTPKLPEAKLLPPYLKTKTITDAKGRKTVFEYDRWSNELKVTKSDGTTITRTWHKDFNLPLTETNEAGITTAYDYDAKGNLLTLTEAKGTADERTTRYTYDQYGQIKSETTGESAIGNTALATTYYEYDQYGNLTKITNPESDVVKFSDHDVLGNARSIIDGKASALPLGEQYSWKQTYDKAGNLLESLDPYGKGEAYSYYVTGALKKFTSTAGTQYTITSNVNGQPTTLTNAAGNVSKFEYDKGSRLIAIVDENGNRSQLSYNDRNQLEKIIDAEGNVSLLNYSAKELNNVQYPSYKSSFEYDNLGQIKQVNKQANEKVYSNKIKRDIAGSSAKVLDSQDKATVYEYDGLGRTKKITDADGGVTEFIYDSRDNLLQIKDPEGRLTIYTYDKNDRLLSETKDGDQNTNRQYRYEYDLDGNMISSINPEQEKILYEFDKSNRLVKSEVYADKAHARPIKIINYRFNEKSQFMGWDQKVSSTLPVGVLPTADVIALSETYTYNNLEQLESVAANFGSFSKTFSYTYYPNGLKKTYTNPEGITYTYYYNKNNQLMAVHIPGEGQISWANFDWMVPQTLLLPGGQQVSMKYDDFQLLQENVLKKADHSELAKTIYEYDISQNIKKIEKGEGTLSFSYDNLYRLTNADMPNDYAASDEVFDYDGVGNRTSHTENGITESQSYNQKNQLQIVDSSENTQDISYTYSANGHTKTQIKNGVVTEYLYNHEERLIAVKRDGITISEYAYNPNGQRVKKTVNGLTTWYLYNENGLTAEYTSTGQLIKEYQFHSQKAWMTDPLFQRSATGDLYYYHNDHLGTPQQLVDESGNIVWAAQYSAFGKAHITINTVENNLRYPGQYYDEETGLHHNYMRDYDVDTGRYIQSDPIGIMGGLNNFSYSRNHPYRFYDPNGLEALDWLWGAIYDATEWVPDQSTVDFGAGFGDTVTFGLTQRWRELANIGGVDECSSAYGYGQLAGVAASMATGFAAGTKAVATASSKLGAQYGKPLVDFSHSAFPKSELKKMDGRFYSWLNKTGNRLNGDYVPRNLHWRMDPTYRTKFLNDALRAIHVPFGNARALLNRIPYTPGSALYGASSAGLNQATKPNCECKK